MPRNQVYAGQQAIIFGAGALAKVTLEALLERNMKVLAFCDNNKIKQAADLFGYPVWSPERAAEFADITVFVCVAYQYDVVRRQLQEIGFKDIRDVADLIEDAIPQAFGQYSSAMIKNQIRDYIDRTRRKDNAIDLTVVITERCTLRCRHCILLVPYMAQNQDIPLRRVINNIDRMSEVFGKIEFLSFGLGEPFLHKDFVSIMEYVLAHDSAKRIGIITNGTYVPSVNKLKVLAKFDEKIVTISNYGEISSKKEELRQALDLYGIENYILEDSKYWADLGNAEKHNYSMSQLKKVFAACRINRCTQIYNGKLFRCGRLAYIGNMENEHIDEALAPHDYVDLYDPILSDEEIRDAAFEYLNNRTFLYACDHCNCADWANPPVMAGMQI